MEGALTAVSDIALRPLIPTAAIIALAVVALGAVLAGFARGLKGAFLRLLSLAALLLALLNPALVSEEREALSDIVAVVVDESASQTLEDRAEQAAAAAAAVEAPIEALGAAGGGRRPIEVRRISAAASDEAAGTRLMTALTEGLADAPPGRLSGAILITDGAVADGDLRPTAVFPQGDGSLAGDAQSSAVAPAPVHVLLTGRPDEIDRRLVVEKAPAFGLVGEKAVFSFRVEQSGGDLESSASRLARVRAFVDGEPSAGGFARIGQTTDLSIPLKHAGVTVVELRLEAIPGELTERNNAVAFSVNAVRDRLRVLLVSGEPHAGERTWRNLLKSDPAVDMAHFTILRPPSKSAAASPQELALIPFPTRELFQEKLDQFDLIILDRYRRWGILYTSYIANIANYVREGGAILISTGPAFAGFESMYRTPLGRIMPAEPTARILEEPFRPEVTALGARHPVTRGLDGAGGGGADPSWGRWFRQIEVAALDGDVVMQGVDEKPLLILDRVGQGRVGLLASDQVWLWARGYDGGGPQAELLRRLAHWLMKEPELEEEALTAAPVAGGFVVERRSLAPGEKAVRSVGPDGAVSEIELTPAGDGLWRALVETDALGVHRLTDAEASQIALEGEKRRPLSAIAAVGPPAPAEFANPVSTDALLAPAAAASGGAVLRLSAGGAPEIRRVREGRSTAGAGWIGLTRRDAYAVRGVSMAALAPGWAYFALAGLFALAAWRVEGR
ncbi:MAG: hypothetical protein AAF909_11950 [Pseudomonadota bacterium]